MTTRPKSLVQQNDVTNSQNTDNVGMDLITPKVQVPLQTVSGAISLVSAERGAVRLLSAHRSAAP